MNTTPNPDALEPNEPELVVSSETVDANSSPLAGAVPGESVTSDDEIQAQALAARISNAAEVNEIDEIANIDEEHRTNDQPLESSLTLAEDTSASKHAPTVDSSLKQPMLRSSEAHLNTNVGAQGQTRLATPDPSIPRDVKKDFARQSRRSFLVLGAAAVGRFSGFRWLQASSTDGGVHWPLRKGLNASSALQRTVFGDSATVATHDKSEARELRRNGSEGVKTPLGPNDNQQTWMIEVQRNGIRMGALKLADLLTLPQVEQTVDHKCVEGWSQIVTWKGIKMADVLAKAEELVEGKRAGHVGFATPDKGYYVTLERSAVKHPQTLLALSLSGEELTDDHGAPCRLAVPTRYGIKSIKRVGIINLGDTQASDYWGQRGYDLYAAF